jgi:hypothetical protein
MSVARKLPECPFCKTRMRLVSILPRARNHPELWTFECRRCRKEVTEIADDETSQTDRPSDGADVRFRRDRAKEPRAIAAKMDDVDAKRLMLEIAVTYDHLAKKAEEGGA